ncbi:MAG TPA: hypothetical protein VIH76_03795 [Candidatus Acidoferrales bacterium]
MSYKDVKIIDGRAIRVDRRSDAEGIPDERMDVHDKTTRAYDAYLELRDTANWMHEELTAQLRHFELTMLEFRVMQVIYRKPLYLEEMSRRLNSEKANVAKVIRLLRMAGWVRSRRRRLPSRAVGARAAANDNGGRRPGRGKKARGRLVTMNALTEAGRAQFKMILARHVKLLKAYMRALDGREQLTLTRLCMKLRRGNILKFALELRWWERDEDWAEVVTRR